MKVAPHRDARSDADLLEAMRNRDPAAWAAFTARFQPVLEAYARKANIPRWDWNVCITELLADEALRLSRRTVAAPRRLDAYLTRAVRNKFLYLKRSAARRDRNYLAASDHRWGECIVPSTCSEHARRASAGPGAASVSPSAALSRLAHDLTAKLTDEERSLLAWVGEGVPRAVMAEWLGIGHEACAKRVWRLCHRLRTEAVERSQSYTARDRREIDRFLRRADTSRARHVSDVRT